MEKLSMDTEHIDMLMEIYIRDNGKMINSKAMESLNLQTDQFTKVNSHKVNLMVKVFITIILNSMMILNNILEAGEIPSLMAMELPHIIIMMCFRVTLLKEKDVETVFIGSIKSTNIWGNGKKIVFGEKENYLEMMKYFFRECSRKD